MLTDTERELRHNLDQAQTGLVQEFQERQATKLKLAEAHKEIETLKEHLRQAYVAIEMLNEKLSLLTRS